MASPKKSDDSKKIMDVAHPNTSAADTSGKPIIISNRPLMKDPMMVDDGKNKDNEDALKKTPALSRLEPLSAPILPNIDGNEVDDEKQNLGKKVIISDSETEVPEKEIEEEKPEKPKEETKEPEKEEAPLEEVAEKVKEDAIVPEEKPEEQINEPKVDSESKDEAQSNDEEIKTDDESPEDIDVIEAAKKAEHDAAIDKLAESKQYYLPINSVEKRKSKRFVSLGILLSLILIVAWADIALDAGLISLSMNIPHTHFFSTSSTPPSSILPVKTTPAKTPSMTKTESQAVTQIKAIQTLLESYFAINNYYPGDLTPDPLINQSGVTVATTSEFSAPSGTKFVYLPYPNSCKTTSKNCQHYNLKAEDNSGKVIETLHSLN